MNTIPFRELKTERLLLRKLKESDWEMVSYLRSDPEVNKFVKRSAAETKEKALEFIHKSNNQIDDGSIYQWCIALPKNQKMIGSICLWNLSEDRKTAEVGYDLATEYHDKGIMHEALNEVLDFGFNMLKLDKIEAYTQQNNESSKKLLEKNGFVFVEGKVDEDNELNSVYELAKHNYDSSTII